MEFEEFKKSVTLQIEKQLKKFLRDWRSEVEKIDTKLLPLVDKFIAGCQGGKMIRGILVVLGYEIGKQATGHRPQAMEREIYKRSLKASLENEFSSSAYKIAASFEIFHNAILVHDDVIDQSPKRRGQPSLYQAIGSGHYGISQAISLGDAGFFLAIKIISESNFPAKEKNEALSWFAKTMLDTAAGEMLDIAKGDVFSIMKLKTARYSVSGPLILGAILGGGEQKLVRQLWEFGENLGVAFQIQDDILGVFGSEKITGKSTASDIEEGKNTLLLKYALKRADSKQKEILEKLYGRGKIQDQEVKALKQVFQKTRALDYAKNEANKYKDIAMKLLPRLTKDRKLSKILMQLAEWLVRREK